MNASKYPNIRFVPIPIYGYNFIFLYEKMTNVKAFFHYKKTHRIPTEVPTDTKVVGHLRRNTDKFPTKSKKMKSSEFRRPFPTEFRRHTVRRNFPTTFRRHSDKKCNRCSRRKFVGIFRRISDDIPINSKVVGIPSVFSDGIPTNHVTVADKYI